MSVEIADIQRARETIREHAHRTPLLSSRSLGERIGAKAFLKAESLQRTGSFKVRGALTAIAAIPESERAAGLITMSAGNHSQATSYAARVYGAHLTVVMPQTAPQTKIEATRGYGGEVVFAPDLVQLPVVAEELRRSKKLRFVHPFDDDDVIAGQGTAALEVFDDLPEVSVIVVPIGGGGLISGIAVACASRSGVRVIGVQPEGAPAARRALDAGKIVKLDQLNTIADGCAAPFIGERNFEIIRRLVNDVVLVSDDEIREGMRLLATRARLIVEPAGAAAVGALLAGRVPLRPGDHVVALISGGNVDLSRFAELLA